MISGVTREMAEAMDLDRPVGALVNDVTEGGAAERAGIQPGDVILEFDGEPIETSSMLPPIVGSNPPGTEAKVLVSRNGETRTFEVTLDALEDAAMPAWQDLPLYDENQRANASFVYREMELEFF